MHRSMCWAPHTCFYSCTLVHIHLEHNYWHIRSPYISHSIFNSELPVENITNTHAASQLTLLTPFSCVAFRARAHIVPHALTSVLTRRTAYGWKVQQYLTVRTELFLKIHFFLKTYLQWFHKDSDIYWCFLIWDLCTLKSTLTRVCETYKNRNN